MDRTNHSNAVSDNLPQDLGFNINIVNTGTAIYAVLFSIFCLSGSVIAKRVGPSRCKDSANIYFRWTHRVLNRDPDPYVCVGTGDHGSRSHQE
jgi:hypothetical protein